MRLIKLALISLIILFGLITLISLLIPSDISITRAVNLRSRPEKVLSLVNDTTNWPTWNPLLAPHPDHPPVKGSITSRTDSSVTASLQQGNKSPVQTSWQVYSFSNSDSVTLRWTMNFHLPWYPWKKFEGIFFEKAYGPLMEQGLQNIKKLTRN
jgi:hypothetical protein